MKVPLTAKVRNYEEFLMSWNEKLLRKRQPTLFGLVIKSTEKIINEKVNEKRISGQMRKKRVQLDGKIENQQLC